MYVGGINNACARCGFGCLDAATQSATEMARPVRCGVMHCRAEPVWAGLGWPVRACDCDEGTGAVMRWFVNDDGNTR